QRIFAVVVHHSVLVSQNPDRVGHRPPARHDRAQMFDTIQQRRKFPGSLLVKVPVVVLISPHQAEFRGQFGAQGHTAVVVNKILLRAQRKADDPALEFRFLGVVEGITNVQLISLRNSVVDLQAHQVAVVGVVPLAGFEKSHVINVIETDQGLVKGDVDCKRRADLDTPTRLFAAPERVCGVVIIKAPQNSRNRPRLGLLHRGKARRISSLQTDGTKRSYTGGSDDFLHKILSSVYTSFAQEQLVLKVSCLYGLPFPLSNTNLPKMNGLILFAMNNFTWFVPQQFSIAANPSGRSGPR